MALQPNQKHRRMRAMRVFHLGIPVLQVDAVDEPQFTQVEAMCQSSQRETKHLESSLCGSCSTIPADQLQAD